MRVPVNAEAAGIPRRAGLPALEPRRVEHHGGGVVAVAQRGGYLVACRLIVDLQGGKQDVALGVHLDAADSRSQNIKGLQTWTWQGMGPKAKVEVSLIRIGQLKFKDPMTVKS